MDYARLSWQIGKTTDITDYSPGTTELCPGLRLSTTPGPSPWSPGHLLLILELETENLSTLSETLLMSGYWPGVMSGSWESVSSLTVETVFSVTMEVDHCGPVLGLQNSSPLDHTSWWSRWRTSLVRHMRRSTSLVWKIQISSNTVTALDPSSSSSIWSPSSRWECTYQINLYITNHCFSSSSPVSSWSRLDRWPWRGCFLSLLFLCSASSCILSPVWTHSTIPWSLLLCIWQWDHGLLDRFYQTQ